MAEPTTVDARVHLLPARERDFPAVARLFVALHAFNATLDERFALAEGWESLLREHFLHTYGAPGALWLLAWAGERPVGLLLMEAHADSPLFAQRRWAELVALYVDKSWRGSDLGRHLVEAGKQWASDRGFDRLQLYVTAGNAHAKRFYSACGLYPAQEIWRADLTPRPDATLPPDPSAHTHPELGTHHLAMELHPRDDHDG
jgi:GNAT superfamily N-acetyltransferase